MLCGKPSRRLAPWPAAPSGRTPACRSLRLARNSSIKPRYFEARIALIFASLFVSTGDQPSLFSAMARGQRLRCRADRRDPGGADVPARRHDAVPHRLCRHGQRPRQCAAAAGRRGTGVVLRVFPAAGLRDRAGCLAGAVRRLDAACADYRFAGAVGRAAVRLELHQHADLGIDLVSRGQFRRWHDPGVDEPAGRACHHDGTASCVGLLDGADRAAPGQTAPCLAALGRGPAGRAETAEPLLRAVRHRRRPDQRKPRLHVRIRLDLLEVGRARRHADGLPLGVCRRLGSVCVSWSSRVCSAAFARPRC